MAVTLTVNFNFPKPDPEANVDEELYRLQTTLDAIDAAMKTIADDAASRAGVDHNHPISDITGLAAALEGKMSASQTFLLDDLSDVAGASGAANGYILVKSTTGWVPSTAIAALGTHGHLIGEVSGLAEALASKAEASAVATALGSKADAAAMATGLSGKLDKTGGRLTGWTEIVFPNAGIAFQGSNRRWFWQAADNGSSPYFRLVDESAGAEAFHVKNDGSIWCRQLGDLSTRIEERGSAWGQHHSQQWGNVANALASMSAGGVGSLVFAKTLSATVGFGGTIAGSSLTPTNSAVADFSPALAGTWRCLGYVPANRTASLFVRIA